jgi:hypothetical protein
MRDMLVEQCPLDDTQPTYLLLADLRYEVCERSSTPDIALRISNAGR